MIRAQRFVVSRPMYAFDPRTWRPASGVGFEVEAIWFKRHRGVLSAVRGVYHPMVIPVADRPTDDDYASWITAANDNRYGGKWAAKWDGTGLLVFAAPVSPAVADEHIAFLDPMLKNFPDVPPGYDGWWTFPRAS